MHSDSLYVNKQLDSVSWVTNISIFEANETTWIFLKVNGYILAVFVSNYFKLNFSLCRYQKFRAFLTQIKTKTKAI